MRKGFSQSPIPPKQRLSPLYSQEQLLSGNNSVARGQNQYMQQNDQMEHMHGLNGDGLHGMVNGGMVNNNGMVNSNGVTSSGTANSVNGGVNANNVSNPMVNGIDILSMNGVDMSKEAVNMTGLAPNATGQMNMSDMAMNGLNFDMNGTSGNSNMNNMGMTGNVDGRMNFGGDGENSDLLFGTPLAMSF